MGSKSEYIVHIDAIQIYSPEFLKKNDLGMIMSGSVDPNNVYQIRNLPNYIPFGQKYYQSNILCIFFTNTFFIFIWH